MKGVHPKRLATHLNLWIISLCIFIFTLVLGANYFLSRHLLEDYIERLANKSVESAMQRVDTVLHSITRSTDALAAEVADPDVSKKHIRQMIEAFAKNNHEIFGMAVALEPDVLGGDTDEIAPYYFRNGNTVIYTDLAENSYQKESWQWYAATKSAEAAVWSEPYVDGGISDVHMVTYSTPIHFAEGTSFAGVAKTDIKLSWLNDIIRNSKIGKFGFGFIVSQNDTIIAHPDRSLHMKHIKKSGIVSGNWARYVDSKNRSSTTHFSTPCLHQIGDCRISIMTLKNTGWKIVIVFPERELIADLNALTLKISVVAATGLLFLFVAIVYVSRTLTAPLSKLASATKDIGAGNLDIDLPEISRKDEIGALTYDFNTMRSALKKHIAEIKETTARQQKLESEIQIAKDIQLSMIPGAGNVSFKKQDHQLFALLRPAGFVGGDLYYYQQWKGSLYFIIGDVSDKGVPAALFMAKTVTLYTRALREGLSPGETFTMMNEILTQNNEARMFVTALCGRVNLLDRSITMSSAGHMNPVLKNGTKTEEIEIDGATALGLMQGIHYPDTTFRPAPASSLIMYTDGISEAHDKAGDLYGVDTLIQFITNLNELNADEIGNGIIDIVDAFAFDTEQFDDITILIVHLE